jgi:hypothetical protein
MEDLMEVWVLAALAGICPVGWPRYPINWDWLLWLLRHFPPPPKPPRPNEGPLPEPWDILSPFPQPWTVGRGILGALGGIASFAILGGRFGGDGMWAVIGLGFLGGCAGLWVADVATQLRGARNLKG